MLSRLTIYLEAYYKRKVKMEMTIKQLMTELQKHDEDLEIVLESHCGAQNFCVGVLKRDDCIILCNEEGYAQKELAR